MSKDWKPYEQFLVDLQMGGKTRGELTLTDAKTGESFRIDNHLAKDRYPELSFLYAPFDDLYKRYENNPKALELLDKIEDALKDCETELIEGSASVPFKGKYDDTVEAWFKGELDKSFYYREENNRLFGEYIEMSLAAYMRAIQLVDVDDEYHIEADIPRTDERVYTYQIGQMNGQNMLVDMYAGRNANGDLTVHNLEDGWAYTVNPSTEEADEYYRLDKELERLLEEDAKQHLKEELGLAHKGHGTIVVLAGASGSGKDTIRNALVERGYERLVTSTTRSPRAGEQDGVDYHFKSVEEFEQGIQDGSIFEYRKYESADGAKYYGSQKQELDPNKDYVIVLDDTGIEDYQKAYGQDKVFAVLTEVPDEIRYQRAFDRAFPEKESFGMAWDGNKQPAPNGGHITYESKDSRIEQFNAEWETRLADDKNRFSEEFVGRAVNFRLDNEFALDDVVKSLQNAQIAYEQVAKPDKHYVVTETMKFGQLSYAARENSQLHKEQHRGQRKEDRGQD